MDISSEPARDFSIFGDAVKWFCDSVAYRGLWATFRELAIRVFGLIRDIAPSRRRLRYGDLQFDFDNGVDTTWSNISLSTRIRELFSGEQYQASDPDQFHEMIGGLDIDCADFTFIDLGSGKGRVLLLASEYPFRRIIGLEILPELDAIAKRNIKKFPCDNQRCMDIQSWCGDARDFVFPPEPILLYLFNPFFEPVLEKVLVNLENSARNTPRNVLVVYVNPVAEHILGCRSIFTKITGNCRYCLYRYFPETGTSS